jgi:uncharacterized RDD family membrane protein YckC
MASRERLRASDRDRDQAAERLREAAAEGRLSTQELDERLTQAFSALTYGELDTLTDDLPVPVPAPPPPRLARAGWWRRLAAWLIDGIIVGLVTGVLTGILHSGVGTPLGVLVSVGYFVFFEGGPRGAAAGKQAMGLRVADAHTLAPIGYGRAFVRWLGHILSGVVFLLGYFWMLGDADSQCWHDKLAGDVVVFSDGRTESDALRPY